MKSYFVNLKQEFNVKFSDPELAEEYFAGEDTGFTRWFYESLDLEDFLEAFTLNFANEVNRNFGDLNIEGFATFKRDGNHYTSIADEYGTITVQDVSRGLELDYIVE